METEYDGYVSNHEGRGDEIEDNEIDKVNNDAYSHHVDLTETELSQDMFYESVKILMKTSEKRRERRHSIRKQKRKRSRTSYEQPNEAKAYSRCSLPYLFTVIKKVLTCPHYVHILKNIGFDFMLELDDCYIPRHFVQWVADHVDTDKEVIRIGSKDIHINI